MGITGPELNSAIPAVIVKNSILPERLPVNRLEKANSADFKPENKTEGRFIKPLLIRNTLSLKRHVRQVNTLFLV